MTQEVGETSKAIVENDEKIIEQMLNANKERTDLYWIVIFASPSKVAMEGRPTLTKVIKAYGIKPKKQVGMIVGEVNNKRGTIRWEINMPDKPFGFELLGIEQDGCQVYETSIPGAYVYN
jgi:hypothetical protein